MREGLGGLIEREDGINHGLKLSGGSPFKRGLNVGAVATVTADQPLLLHKEWPEVERHFAPRCRATRYDRAPACKAIKNFLKHLAADVFDDQIHAAFASDLADLRRPVAV